MTRYAWRSVRYLPGDGCRGDPTHARRRRRRVPARHRRRRGRRRARQPRRVAGGGGCVAARRARRRARGASAAGAAPRATSSARCSSASLRADSDHDATATLRAAADGKLDLLVLLGADPVNDCPDATSHAARWRARLGSSSVDTFLSDSTQQADLVLAAAAFGEQDGTTTNLEGRVTPVAQAVTAHGTARPDWMIAAELALMFGRDVGFDSIQSATAASVAVAQRRQFGALPEAAAAEPPPNSYDYRVVVSRKLYDRAVGTANSPRHSPRSRSGREPTSIRSTSIGSASPRAPTSSSSASAARSCCHSSPTRPCSAARSGRRSTRKAPTSPISSTSRRPRPTSGSSGCDGAGNAVGHRSDDRHRRLVVGGARDRRRQGAGDLRDRARRHDVHGVVRAQDRLGHAEPHRPEQGRPVGSAADARRRHQAVLQGRPAAGQGRPVGVPVRAVPRLRAGLPAVVGDPARRRLHRRQRRHRRVVRPRRRASSSPTRRSASCWCWR